MKAITLHYFLFMFAISRFVDHLLIDKLLHAIRIRTDLDDKALMFKLGILLGFFSTLHD